MEELFRFSVLRPADRFVAQTVALSSAPPAPGAGRKLAPPLQQQLIDIVNAEAAGGVLPPAATVWKRFEPIALAFLKARGAAILADPLWDALENFWDSLQTLLANWGQESTLDDVTKLFGKAPDPGKQSEAYKSDLSDLFLALLIIRRGGPVEMESIVRSQGLWSLVELIESEPTLSDVADRILAAELLRAGAQSIEPPASTPVADMQAALARSISEARSRTILLPPGLFSQLAKPVHGVGFREFHVVKQHIRRYQLAEIGRIENILMGESRSTSRKHTLSTETDTFFQDQTTTETDKELTSDDRVDIKNEADNQVKQDTKIDAGVHASYDGGSFKLATDLAVSYAKSTDDTKKFSSDVAKDVTQKATTKVTDQVTRSQTTKIIETFLETERHRFDNTKGAANISGVYQWVEKVYLAQTFNLGRHMLLDFTVPEPGSNFLELRMTPVPDTSSPTPPAPMQWLTPPAGQGSPRPVEISDDLTSLKQHGAVIHDLSPLDLLPDELDNPPLPGVPYLSWLGRYGVTGVLPSPPRFTTFGKPVSQKDDGDIVISDQIQIDDGYEAISAFVELSWKHSKGDDETGIVTVQVAASSIVATENQANRQPGVLLGVQPSANKGDQSQNSYFIAQVIFKDLTVDTEVGGTPRPIVGFVPISVSAPNIALVNVSVELLCRRLTSGLRAWQLQTYEKIVTAYRQLESDYQSKTAAQAQAKADASGTYGSSDSDDNRLTERIELKRACIAIIDNNNATTRGGGAVTEYPTPAPAGPSDPSYPQLPETNLSIAQSLGSNIRWFEQAFEWENMAYVSYPYYWARRQTWPTRANLQSPDTLFQSFLQAGYARVVVPVRLGFEHAVHFYLHIGLPWLGGALPAIGDKSQNPLYLDIAEEIKVLTGGPGETETPVGDPWEYTLPTTLIKLRDDSNTPEWHRIGPDGNESAAYPSNEPPGPWSWLDGEPTI